MTTNDDESTEDGAPTVDRVRRGVKALSRSDDGVLLVEERRPDGSTFWTLPGGGRQTGESSRQCLRRELEEELGQRPSIGAAPIGTCSYRHQTIPATVTVYTVFPVEPMVDPAPNPAEGVLSYTYARPSNLPDSTLETFAEFLRATADSHSRGLVESRPRGRTPR